MFLWTDLRMLVVHPSRGLAEIASRRRADQAALALGLSLLLPAVFAELAAFAPYRPPANLGSLPSLTAQGADIYARWTYQHRFWIPVVEVLVGLVLWLAAGLLIHLGARALKGRGDLSGYLELIGFVALVGLVAIPVSALDALARLSSNVRAAASIGSLAGFVGVAVFLWQNVLLILAAQAHYGLSVQRAVTAVVGPIGCLVVLGMGLVFLAAIAAVLGQGAL
ncbi:MAG: YIP1 family protein [Candidatus Dormibacteraeota bacterium]|nr:YIP1 family protein [Candidatus Dormibacteraeota bacterium]